MPRAPPTKTTTREKVSQYELIFPLLKSMYAEFQELSKKKQDGGVTLIKIKMVNRILKPIHDLLADEDNIVYLDLLDEDELPENSDVVIILGQTVAAMNAYRESYYYFNGAVNVWSI